MDSTLLIFCAASAIAAVAILVVRNYLIEKGKNFASKQDLSKLTELVESVKASHAQELERLKATLSSEGQLIEIRRRIYEEICSALRIFIDGQNSTPVEQERFHVAHAAAWLWAPDEILTKLNHLLGLLVKNTAHPGNASQTELKSAYVDVILAMRKDTGFPNTIARTDEYNFLKF